ncbi:hypothetical protein CC117_20195 [Parafrankia colletiae]|uniref:RNA-binding protein containing a PIN domain n=1 Tax=Parafrankia colletiae TaxID=573497 RepID=A0A1S1QNJ1_9ACTN|nr:NYN domain-containing protein [Parafrankia colletiae]MCK9904397.1 NYN domain-containing protein [Frankia sp. Cpl3]OHV35136.1 hypothetical protein CC117_20195 [Parafrankia colletiae]
MTETLPADVRSQVVVYAAEALAELADAVVPASLVAVRRFKASRRARLGAVPLAAAIEQDAHFRGRVAEWVRRANPDLVAAITAPDGPPPAAPPAQMAAIAYILRLPDWVALVEEAARSSAQEVSSARMDEATREISRLQEQIEAVRRLARTEQEQLRAQLDEARAEAEEARRRLRASGDRVRRAEIAAREISVAAETARDIAAQAARDSGAEAKRLRARVHELEAAASATRRDNRDSRSMDEARLRVLLDTLMAAANGVRRELSLPTTVARPADLISRPENDRGFDPFSGVGGRGRADDDPAIIDDVLAVPGLHLIIDGYNVTKRGYGALTLQAQRARLLAGLGALAGRALDTAEVTVVFDATAVVARPVGVAMPRGVRVVFSQAGELADDEIRRLVRAEPPGRPVAVVTSDREVAENCASLGARTVSSDAMLSRLDR